MNNPLPIEKINEAVAAMHHIGDKENFFVGDIELPNWGDKDKNLFYLWLSHNNFIVYVNQDKPHPHNQLRNLTKKGILLRRLGSYDKYLERIKAKDDEKQLQIDFIKAQNENAKSQLILNPLIRDANKSTIVTNRVLIAILTLTLIVYIGQLVVAYKTLMKDDSTSISQNKYQQDTLKLPVAEQVYKLQTQVNQISCQLDSLKKSLKK